MAWSTDASIQKRCADSARSVLNEPDTSIRSRRALALIANALNLGLTDERCVSYCSMLAMAALYPDDYRIAGND